MASWLKREGFDRYKIMGTATSALLMMGLGVVVRPILILSMQVTLYVWVTFAIAAPYGYIAQHLSDKIVSAMSGGYIHANHGTSLLLDAIRSLIYGVIESATCAAVILVLPILLR